MEGNRINRLSGRLHIVLPLFLLCNKDGSLLYPSVSAKYQVAKKRKTIELIMCSLTMLKCNIISTGT